jgi:hypothetical protein
LVHVDHLRLSTPLAKGGVRLLRARGSRVLGGKEAILKMFAATRTIQFTLRRKFCTS